MKRLWWSVAVGLGVALAAVAGKELYSGISAWRDGGDIRKLRFIQPRLTMGRVYSRCEPRTEAGMVSEVWCKTPPGAGQAVSPSAAKAAGHAGEGPSRGSLPADLHLDGAAQLITSQDQESLDQAVRRLESDALSRPNARTLNDLATAYFVRGQQTENLYDLILALSTIDKAVREDGRLPEALFNRALFLQEMSLRTEAWLAWQKYLSLPEETGWSTEAQARLQSLRRISAEDLWKQQREALEAAALRGDTSTAEEIVTRFRQAAQKYAAEQALGQWGEALLARDDGRAGRFLLIARTIGEALRQIGGDEMIADTVAAIAEARTAPAGSARLHGLAEGHRAYSQGMAAFSEQRIDAAQAQLERAERALREARSPFLPWARLQVASCDYHHDKFAEARQALEGIDQSLPDDRYPSLRGRIHFILGSADFLQGRPGDSLQQLQRARDFFSRTGEIENLATINQNFAITLGILGSDDLWHYLFHALRPLAEIPSHRRVFGILDETGAAALRAGHPEVALYFENEMLETGRHFRDPEQITFALQRKADTLAALRGPAEAMALLALASRESELIPDPKMRARAKAGVSLSSGQARLAAGHPDLALADLTHALDYLRAAGYRSSIPLALFLRARAALAAGDSRRAAEDFAAGLEEIETTRENLSDETLRISFTDQATQAFDEILSFQAGEKGGETAAFELAEQARARELLEDLAVSQLAGEGARAAGPRLLTVAELRNALPERTLLVKYAVLPDRLLLWTLTRRELKLRTIPLRMQDLDHKVRRVLAGMQAGQGAPVQQALGELYLLLLSPVEQELQSVRDLVVVPDKSLHLLPFSALIDPRTHHYLIESHGVVMAPSANIYVRCLSQRVNQIPTPPVNALLIGDPKFDRQEFPSLDRLPDAATEVKTIAGMYPATSLLVDDEATKWNVLHQIARGPEVIQISAHALESSEHPEYSRLLLAGDARRNDKGSLYLHEVRNLHFKGTRLVVLAGCGTAAGPLSASEGFLSLARSFLASGVPAVVATRWNIDDATSRQLVTEFHRRLRSGEDPVTALRRSQIAQAKDQARHAGVSWNWASFQLIGGINSTEKGDR